MNVLISQLLKLQDRHLVVVNNLTNGPIRKRDYGHAVLQRNLVKAMPDWFKASEQGDFHLVQTATQAIDAAADLPEVRVDFDGDERPQGSASDIGADEYRPAL